MKPNRSFVTSIQIPSFMYVIAALAVLIVPLKWAAAVLISCFVHELCHYVMLRICRVPVAHIVIGMRGIRMHTQAMSAGKELACALAGPVGGLILASSVRWYPQLSFAALLHSVYNLIPVYPSDGYRSLGSLLQILFPQKAASSILRILVSACACALLIAGWSATFVYGLGITPFAVGLYMVIRNLRRKIPCKVGAHRVQWSYHEKEV